MNTNQHRFAEILAGIEEERHATEGVTWKELLLPANRKRVLITIALQIGDALVDIAVRYNTDQVDRRANDRKYLLGIL